MHGACSLHSVIAGTAPLQEVHQGDLNYINDAVKHASYAYNEVIDTDNIQHDMSVTESGQDAYVPVHSGTEHSDGNSPGDVSVQVNVQMSPAFNISSQETGNQSTGEIMRAIRKHMSEIANEIGGEIADRLEEAFANMAMEGSKEWQ